MNEDKDKITLDRETFKALAADSRIEILKMLEEHKLTLTDLTQKLDMSPSTIKEHIDRLSAAGLIELIPGETKWKYYKLTRKGKNVLNPYETKVWFVLAVSLLSLFGVLYNLFGKIMSFNVFMKDRVFESMGGKSAMLAPAAAENISRESGGLILAKSLDAVPTTLADSMKEAGVQISSATTTTLVNVVQENLSSSYYTELLADTGLKASNATTTTITRVMQDASSTTLTPTTTTLAKVVQEVSSTTLKPVTTTLARVIQESSSTLTQILKGIPLAEIALALFLTLVVGLCVGMLVKKKRFI